MLGPLVITGAAREILEVGTVFILILTIVVGYALWSFVKGAGFEPVPGKVLDEMVEFSQPGPGKQVYDLGSGFGRIIMKVAQKTGASCTGLEVDPLKVWWTRRQIASKRLQGRVRVLRGDLLEAEIAPAVIVFVFLWHGIMQKLKEKAMREMKPGSLIVSYFHEFDGWAPERQDREAKVYLYRIPVQGS